MVHAVSQERNWEDVTELMELGWVLEARLVWVIAAREQYLFAWNLISFPEHHQEPAVEG
jgi:hypothetical protein